MTEAAILIQWLLEKKLCYSSFDKFLNEQMINITQFGSEVNAVLNKLKEESKQAEQTNVYAAEKLKQSEVEPK